MKSTLIQICILVEYPIFGLEADSGVGILSKTGVKVLNIGPVEEHILRQAQLYNIII